MPYEKSADVWSLGCILYEMFTGRVPFLANNPLQLANLIRTQGVFYPSYIPDDAKELIHQLVRKSPNNRYTLAQVKETAFFKKSFSVYQLPKASTQPVKAHPVPPKPKRPKNTDPNKASASNPSDSPNPIQTQTKLVAPGTPVEKQNKSPTSISTPLPSNSPYPTQQVQNPFNASAPQQQQLPTSPVANPPPVPQRRVNRLEKMRGMEEKKKFIQTQEFLNSSDKK